MSGETAGGLDTFPKLLAHNARMRGGKPASREKDYGIWQTWTWSEVADEVRALACGLAALGFRRGDRLAIVGDNRPHLYWAMPAAQAVGGVPVPVYQDSVAEEMQYVLSHAECRFALVENQEQVDKLLEIKDRLPHLETIIYHFPRGMRNYRHDFLHLYAKVQEEGRAYDQANPGFYDGEVAKGSGADLAEAASSTPLAINSASWVSIHPPTLEFTQRPLCIPAVEVAELSNGADTELSVLSVTTDNVHFHPSSFKATTLSPGEALNISIVFLPRTIGSVEGTLVIQTSAGGLLYQIHAQGVANPYRLPPFLSAKLPTGATYSPPIQV